MNLFNIFWNSLYPGILAFFFFFKEEEKNLDFFLAAPSRSMFIPAGSLSPPHLLLAVMWQIGSRF